jgi:acid phosphatase (class A)
MKYNSHALSRSLLRFITCTGAAAALATLAACSAMPPTPSTSSVSTPTTTPTPSTDPLQVGEYRAGSGYLKGYLSPAQYPDSLALLPPPPLAGSAAQAADNQAFEQAKALRLGARGQMAFDDNNLKFPAAAGIFSCAVGLAISPEATPHTNMLLRRTLVDAGLPTYKAKNHYQRMRPFATFKESTCAPKEDAALAKDGAYPSGHAALGWAWALVLSEIAPERSDAILQRGHAFGQSRVICGAHWQTDVEAGRLVGSAAVAKQHTDPVFTAQLAAAKLELAQARAKLASTGAQTAASPACVTEAQALTSSKK